jgi:regulator of cell morphogenesis and NO signaling
MNSIATKTVRDLAVEVPGATRVFENLGIDYCCGGQRLLADACAAIGISLDDVEESLETANSWQFDQPNFLTGSLAELIDHIVEKHHVFTKKEITRLNGLLDKVCGVHGENHPELEKIRSLFQDLSAELEPHMMKEECVLFPFIVGMEEGVHMRRAIQVPPFGTVANPVRMMMREHDGAGELLKEMRRITANYTAPEDACISYQTLYQALDAFEKDLHQHIHLENNVLFPRSLEMEEKAQPVMV